MRVKVCGITTEEAANAVVAADADFIGFVFAPSKRRISPVNAAGLATKIPSNIKKVGVFVNESKENICMIAKTVGLDYIQLHGDEDAAFAQALPYPIIKAFSINQATSETVRSFPCDYYLIDSPGQAHRGGSGKVFNWEQLTALKLDHDKLILAGGLSADNISDAIAAVHPTCVDVSSGVEVDGRKNNDKISQFVKLAKQHNRKVGKDEFIHNA